jgi:hypothetical protein
MWTDDKFQPYPDPQKPGAIIMGQEVWATVHTDTACAIYESCKRIPFVSSVSALGSPAGFLNFQGHNALNDAHQYISFNFSNDITKSLAFSDSLNDFPYDSLLSCDYKTNQPEIHNFTVSIYRFSLHKIVRAIHVRRLATPAKVLSTPNLTSWKASTTS